MDIFLAEKNNPSHINSNMFPEVNCKLYPGINLVA